MTGRRCPCGECCSGDDSASIRVLVVDDHPAVRTAVTELLSDENDLTVVGECEDGSQVVDAVSRLRPDVVLMDISMPVLDGFAATKQLRKKRPDLPVLMLTGSNSRGDVDKARTSGAAGYVTKDRIAGELIDAIIEVVERQGPS
jgi:DNA-binding NarL/FixJ family response regulator